MNEDSGDEDARQLDVARRIQLAAELIAADDVEPTLEPVRRMAIFIDWANALRELAQRRSSAEACDLLVEASARYDAALAVCDPAPASMQWVVIQCDKGATLRSLGTLQRGVDRRSTYEAAITCYDQALTCCPIEQAPQEWTAIQTDKGVVFQALAESAHGEERVQFALEAIACYEAIFLAHPMNVAERNWVALNNKKGMALRILAREYSGQPQRHLLEEAIACFNAALTIAERQADRAALPDSAYVHTNRAATLESLALLLTGEARVHTYGDALADYDVALSIYSRDVMPLNWAMVQNDRGTTVQALADLLVGEEQQRRLREAIRCFDAALEIYTQEVTPFYWATAQNNKGEAWRQLAGAYVRDDERAQALTTALLCYDAALEEYRRDQHPFLWAGAQNNKGAALCSLGVLVGAREARQIYADALACYDAALLEFLSDVAPLEWAMTHNNMGTALLEMSHLLVDADERRNTCEVAIRHFTNALQVRRADNALLVWAESNNNQGVAWLELASMLAGHEERIQALKNAIVCHQAAYEAATLLVAPNRHRATAAALARAHITLALELPEHEDERQRELEQAWTAILTGLEATAQIERLAPTRAFLETEWAESAALFSLAAAVQALQGNLADAIAQLEAGRTRGLSEEYLRRHAQLEALSDAEQRAYRAAVNDVLEIEALGQELSSDDFARLVEEAHARDVHLAGIIGQIRASHPAFMRQQQWTLDELTGRLRQGEALVYMQPYSFGTLLLGVFRDQAPQVSWLREMTTEKLLAIAVQLDARSEQQLGYLPVAVGKGTTTIASALDAMLPTLGEQVMAHVVQWLRKEACRRVVIAPGGLYTVLPLHIATYTPLFVGDQATMRDGRRYACDDLIFAYAPSGRVLAQVRATAARLAQPRQALVVANPQLIADNDEHWRPGALGYLPFAEVEARQVVDALRAAGFAEDGVTLRVGKYATRQGILEGLRTADIAHLALHAIFMLGSPRSSGLRVAPGELLTMRELMDERFLSQTSLRLVALSACQTGLGDVRRLREEAVGIYGALLAVGAAGVAASMWPVNDASTATLMGAFVREYLANGYDGAAALDHAMQAMRSLEDENTGAPAHGSRHLTSADPQMRPSTNGHERLSHPSRWAAFVYYGA